MYVRVRLFAIAKEVAQVDYIDLTLPDAATIGQLRAAVAERYPVLKETLARSIFAVDEDYARDDQVLPEGADVACIPPVSGGSDR